MNTEDLYKRWRERVIPMLLDDDDQVRSAARYELEALEQAWRYHKEVQFQIDRRAGAQ